MRNHHILQFAVITVAGFASLAGFPGAAFAQDGTDSAQGRPAVETQPVAGYDLNAFNPFFIQDPTGQFRLNIGAYAQVRYEVSVRDGDPDEGDPVETGWSLNRTRLFFQGRYSDSFDFRIAVNVDSQKEFDLQQAYFTYYFGDVWQLWVGQQFFNSMREDWPDPTMTSSMENSAVDYTFALGPAFGAFLRRAPTGKTRSRRQNVNTNPAENPFMV